MSSFSCFSKAGGNGSSGGGSGYITIDGRVVFKDLSAPSILPSFLNKRLEKKYLFSKNRYVKELGYKYSNSSFFQCAIDLFEKNNYRALNILIENLKNFEVYMVDMSLEKIFTHYKNSNSNLKLIAAYAASTIFVRERYYKRMSKRDQCGLAVHEALRVFSDTGLSYFELNNKDIEAMTRLIINGKLSYSDPLYSKSLRYNSILKNEEYAIRKFDELTAPEFMVKDGNIIVGNDYIGPTMGIILRDTIDNQLPYKIKDLTLVNLFFEIIELGNKSSRLYDTLEDRFVD